ncbi:spore coat protein U domain-containing protein [Sphingomonas parapaucimobilis]|uniref:spore coat protein U domain-containing protein n=1 Tax=Sphingomonas parapaucimobilis TaxID=28213 RepID=UPI00391DF7B9
MRGARVIVSGLALACGLGGVTSPAWAGRAGRSIQVSGYYGTTCGATMGGVLNFGTLNPAQNPTNRTYTVGTTVSVTCSSTTTFGIWSALTTNASGTQRRMWNPVTNSFLNYTLYLDAPSGTVMPTSSTTSGYSLAPSNASGVSSTLYVSGIAATLASGQALQAGHYEDNIVITVSY